MIRGAFLLVLGGLLACHEPPAASPACACTPGNVSRTKLTNGAPLDGAALLDQLRRHKRDVEQHRTPRDIKVFDDELRFAILGFCQPCGSWVGDRSTIEAMFPLERLDDAVDGVCMGLVLRDGTTAYGELRPAACR